MASSRQPPSLIVCGVVAYLVYQFYVFIDKGMCLFVRDLCKSSNKHLVEYRAASACCAMVDTVYPVFSWSLVFNLMSEQ